jgi:TPR repeat protein
MFYGGKGTQKDFQKAFEWYQKGMFFYWCHKYYMTHLVLFLAAAEAGNPEAQLFIGMMLYYGRGTQKDFQKAFEWLQKGIIIILSFGN